MGCYFGVAAMMFGGRVDPKSTQHPLLNFSVEKRTVNVLVIHTVLRVFTTVGASIHQYWIMRLGFALSATINTLLAMAMLVRMLYVLLMDRIKLEQFATEHHLSDFMCCCALMVYFSHSMVLQGMAAHQPPTTEAAARSIILQQVGLQIALLYL